MLKRLCIKKKCQSKKKKEKEKDKTKQEIEARDRKYSQCKSPKGILVKPQTMAVNHNAGF